MDLARTVDGDPHQETVLGEEGAPLVGQQRAVGLDRVHDPLARPPDRLGQFDRAPEEVQAHHRRLTALPGDDDLGRRGVRPDQLAQVHLKQVIGHPEAAPRVQHLLGQEEAVGAVQVADRSGRLGEQVEASGAPAGSSARDGYSSTVLIGYRRDMSHSCRSPASAARCNESMVPVFLSVPNTGLHQPHEQTAWAPPSAAS